MMDGEDDYHESISDDDDDEAYGFKAVYHQVLNFVFLRLRAGNIGVNVKTIVPHFCDIWHCFLNTCNETFCIVFHPLLLSSLCPEEAKTALIAEETVKGSILLH